MRHGHLHDDNLAVELYADRRLLFFDPGTYVYTSLPDARNAYRVAAAHHAPRAVGWDATRIDPGLLFQCPSALSARLLYVGVEGLAAELRGPKGEVLLRTIEIGSRAVIIRDGVEGGVLRPLAPPLPYCSGYGKPTAFVADLRCFPQSAASGSGLVGNAGQGPRKGACGTGRVARERRRLAYSVMAAIQATEIAFAVEQTVSGVGKP